MSAKTVVRFVVGEEYVDVRNPARTIRILARTADFVEIEDPAKHERRRVKIRTWETDTPFVGGYDVVEYLSTDDGLFNPTGRHVDTPF